MYRCCQCTASIGWFPAAMSTVVSPMRCGACATEQHRRQPLVPFLVFFLAMTASAVIGTIVSVQTPALIWLGILPMVATGIGWEAWLYGRGKMVPTKPGVKRVVRVLVIGWIGFWLAALALGWYLSPQ